MQNRGWVCIAWLCCWCCGLVGSARAQWFDDYQDLAAIYDRLDDFAADYPDLVTPMQLGTSYEGREIRGIKIAGTNPTRPIVRRFC